MKTCSRCLQIKVLADFFARKRSRDGLSPVCKVCQTAYTKMWQKTHAEQYKKCKAASARKQYATRGKKYHVERTYGIAFETFTKMVQEQNGACYICRKIPKSGLVIDHDHVTGKVRKLLCHRCNMALGYGKEDPNVFNRMISYIKEHT